MTKKLICLVLAVLMVLSLAACSKTTETTQPESQAPAQDQPAAPAENTGDDEPAEPAESTGYDTHLTIKMNVLDAEKTGNTERDAWFNEKFNVSWDFIPVTWGDWTEKVRAWVAADDMPDILWWDMKINHTSEFKTWAKAGAFREIPADMSAWPNLVERRERLASDDRMLSVDGKLYGWPSSRENPEWMHNAYFPMFAYRRDWAKAVGMYKEGDIYTWDEAKAMIRAVQEQDPGNNGVNATIGITMETWCMPGVLQEMLGYSEYRTSYQKNEEGHYVPYFTTEAFRNELKFVTDLFQEGYIWKDQIVDSGSDGANNFFAGKSFMHLGNNSAGWLGGTAFLKMVDTGIVSSTDDVGVMIVLSPADNKSFWLTETEDYWTVAHITHSVDDEKMYRILDMWDWLASEEGRIFMVAGLEGKDYEVNADGTYTILWDKNPDGSYISPYADTGSNQYTPATLVPGPNETSRMDGYEAFQGIFDFMQTSPDYRYHPMDWDVMTFGGELYSLYGGFDSEVKSKSIEIMVNGGDVDAQLDAWLAEMEPKWQPVAAELDANLN
ncbi:MAG: hypothetical protein ACI4XW_08570 [Candidatus Spyradocola sp.]